MQTHQRGGPHTNGLSAGICHCPNRRLKLTLPIQKKKTTPPLRAVQFNKVYQPQRESHAYFTRRFAADKRCSLGRTNDLLWHAKLNS
jgi:hypothetical protein